MRQRVRAIVVTPQNQALLIKRIRPGVPPYWVLPGGHVEPTDAGLEEALLREIREELAGEGIVHSLFHEISEPDGSRQHVFMARIEQWCFASRSGEEFKDAERGLYLLEEVPLTKEAFSSIDLRPAPLAGLIVRHLREGTDLFTLPDLRGRFGT